MGKVEAQQLPLQQQQAQRSRDRPDSGIFCRSCSMVLARIGREFNFNCFIVLIFSVAVFLSAVFWVIPHRSAKSGFDAKEAIKLSATAQAYFRLERPVSFLVPHVARLEYDIFGEIGVPFTKVAVLSMHQAGVSNWSNVVFGVLSDPMGVPINPVSLSVLRSSLIELFLQQSNLTLTSSNFGQPSAFEILKFPGGITVIPDQSTSIWQIPQILFNFTLNNSLCEIKENFVVLKEQLKFGLHLRPFENVYLQLTNQHGSTRDPPVTVQASVMSDLGSVLPQRLKQLAQTITGSSPSKNLGLNNTVFGKVKEISLSSYLNSTLHANPPSPSPAPSPEQNDHGEPSVPPPLSPSDSPSSSPYLHHSPPCFNCDASSPSDGSHRDAPSPNRGSHPSFPPISTSPAAPPPADSHPPRPSSHCGSNIPPSNSPHHFAPIKPAFSPQPSSHPPTSLGVPSTASPLPAVSYGSTGGHDKGTRKGSVSSPHASPSISPFPSSSTTGAVCKEIWLSSILGLVIFRLLLW